MSASGSPLTAIKSAHWIDEPPGLDGDDLGLGGGHQRRQAEKHTDATRELHRFPSSKECGRFYGESG
jgi:hypothetical protein